MKGPLLIAVTSNAGSEGHRYLVPKGVMLSSTVLAKLNDRLGKGEGDLQGSDYLAIRQPEVQSYSKRDGWRILQVAGIDTEKINAAQRKRIHESLKKFSDELPTLVAKIDWENHHGFVYGSDTLQTWQGQLGQLPGIPLPIPHSTGEEAQPACIKRQRFPRPLWGVLTVAVVIVLSMATICLHLSRVNSTTQSSLFPKSSKGSESESDKESNQRDTWIEPPAPPKNEKPQSLTNDKSSGRDFPDKDQEIIKGQKQDHQKENAPTSRVDGTRSPSPSDDSRYQEDHQKINELNNRTRELLKKDSPVQVAEAEAVLKEVNELLNRNNPPVYKDGQDFLKGMRGQLEKYVQDKTKQEIDKAFKHREFEKMLKLAKQAKVPEKAKEELISWAERKILEEMKRKCEADSFDGNIGEIFSTIDRMEQVFQGFDSIRKRHDKDLEEIDKILYNAFRNKMSHYKKEHYKKEASLNRIYIDNLGYMLKEVKKFREHYLKLASKEKMLGHIDKLLETLEVAIWLEQFGLPWISLPVTTYKIVNRFIEIYDLPEYGKPYSK